jgi:alkylation response protein AidB-like acyl-CoA dehydrogenase
MVSAVDIAAPTEGTTELPVLREPLTPADILANVQALLPWVAEDAAVCEAQGHLTDRLREGFRAAGTYRVGFSTEHGGPQMSLADQTRMIEIIATVDAGIAWNVCVLAATGFYAGRLAPEAYAELYPNLDTHTCGSFHPKAKAVQVDGGYRVTGTWKFGSGIRAAERILGGVEVETETGEKVRKEDGSVLTLGVWLPTEQVTRLDDWHVIGLRASASQGYTVTDVFVPESHSFDRLFTPTADAEPLNKHVDLPFYSMAGISVGIAQHAVDQSTAYLAAFKGRKPSERQLNLLGEAASYVKAARSMVIDGVSAIDEAIFTPGVVPDETVMARGDAPLAHEFTRIVIDRCAEIMGSQAIYERYPFEKLVRDTSGMSAHASTWRSRWQSVGSALVEAQQKEV